MSRERTSPKWKTTPSSASTRSMGIGNENHPHTFPLSYDMMVWSVWVFVLCCSWASIAAHLPGRTDNDVKNRWYNHLNEKKLGRSTRDQPHTTQHFHLDHNIDPNASSSSSSIPTLVSASQEIASPWPTSELASLESEFMSTEEVIRYFSDWIYMYTLPFC